MRNLGFLLGLLLLLGMSIYCDKQASNPVISDSIMVRGIVEFQGQPLADITVILRQYGTDLDRTTFTAANGSFSFSDIPHGVYILIIDKNWEDGSRSFYRKTVDVSNPVDLKTIVLPRPFRLTSTHVSNRTVTLAWARYEPSDFQEYQIVRSYQPSFDADNSKVIHMSSVGSDTTFLDKGDDNWGLSPDYTYYYRIFVKTSQGQFGSNILEVKTKLWENEESFSKFYKTTLVKNLGGFSGTVIGVAYAGKYLWIATFSKVGGGYYEKGELSLIQFDVEKSSVVKKFNSNDEHLWPSGLALAGDYLWLTFEEGKINKYDPNTGKFIGQIAIEYGARGIVFTGSYFLLNYYYSRIEKWNDSMNSLIAVFEAPFSPGGGEGIAWREGEIWLTDRSTGFIAVLDESAKQIGYAECDALSNWNPGVKICFMEHQLIFYNGYLLSFYNIEEK